MMRPDGPPSPRLTIGLPVYNGGEYLDTALSSLRAQTFEDFELLVSDNASTDDTREIAERHAREDPRIVVDRLERNLGAAPNYNRLVARARGVYFKWAAHDDLCLPGFLAACVGALDEDPGAVLAYPLTRVIDGRGMRIASYQDGLHLSGETPAERLVAYLRGNFIRTQGMCNPIFGVIRTDALRRTRLIQDFVASDRSLLGHLALVGRFVEVEEILFERRVHAGTSTMAHNSFERRKAWFNAARDGGKRRGIRFDNHLALRMTHIRDYFQAISELVDDPCERRACRRALIALLAREPRWIYRDVKYSLGFRPDAARIVAQMGR